MIFKKISQPVLSNLKLFFKNVEVYQLYPQRLPDLFRGSQLIVFGRYKNSGKATVTLTGMVNQKAQTYRYALNFPATSSNNDFVPQIWATRRIGYLMDQIRLNGEKKEIVTEIVGLSKKYGIINTYTSFLIAPKDNGADADKYFKDYANAPNVGVGAVKKSLKMQSIRQAQQTTSNAQVNEAMKDYGVNVQKIQNQIFVQQKKQWVDNSYNKDKDKTIKLKFGSKEYFDTLKKYPKLGKYFSMGKEIIVKYKGVFYEVVN